MLKEKMKRLAPHKKAIAARSVTDRELAVIEKRMRARGDTAALRLIDAVRAKEKSNRGKAKAQDKKGRKKR